MYGGFWRRKKFQTVNCFYILSYKILDWIWIQIWSGFSNSLDLNPDSTKHFDPHLDLDLLDTDPKHWIKGNITSTCYLVSTVVSWMPCRRVVDAAGVVMVGRLRHVHDPAVLLRRVSDPDPHGSALIWVGGSGSAFKLRIQIRIQEGKNSPQKVLKKVQNFHVLKCWMFSFGGWRLLL